MMRKYELRPIVCCSFLSLRRFLFFLGLFLRLWRFFLLCLSLYFLLCWLGFWYWFHFLCLIRMEVNRYVKRDLLKKLRTNLFSIELENCIVEILFFDLFDGILLLVVDSAYAEYAAEDDYDAGAGLVEAFDNVVMTRTFSKIHGLAALRLGWAYCPPAVAGVLNRLRGPFNVSQAAQAAGVAALGDRDHVAHSRRHNARWRAWIAERLAALYLHPYPSAANFVLVRFPGDPERSADAALAYLKENGVLVRAVAAYGLPDCLRITIGTEAEIRTTIEALEGFVARAAAGVRA